MVKLFRLIGFLIILLSSLVTVGSSGRRQPPLFAKLFTEPDGSPCHLPCLFGVRPGQTSHSDALIAIKSHPFTRSFALLTPNTFGGEHFKVVLSTDHKNQVTEIDLIRDAAAPHLTWGVWGEAVSALGAPDRVAIRREFRGDFAVTVYHSANLVTFFRLHSAVYIEAELESISVYAWPPIISSDMSTWAGFGKRYRITIQQP